MVLTTVSGIYRKSWNVDPPEGKGGTAVVTKLKNLSAEGDPGKAYLVQSSIFFRGKLRFWERMEPQQRLTMQNQH